MQQQNNRTSKSGYFFNNIREVESLIFLFGILLIHIVTLVAIFVFAFHGPNESPDEHTARRVLTPELLHTLIMGSFSLLNLVGGFLFGKMKGEADARISMGDQGERDE